MQCLAFNNALRVPRARFTQVSKSFDINPWSNFGLWKLGSWNPLHTGSQVWNGCLHGNILWRWGSGLCWESSRVEPSKKLHNFVWLVWVTIWSYMLLYQIYTNIIVVSWGWKVGTWWHGWDLEFGTRMNWPLLWCIEHLINILEMYMTSKSHSTCSPKNDKTSKR